MAAAGDCSTRVRERSAGLKFSFVDLRDRARVAAALRPETRLIWVESPTNPMLKLADLAAIAALAHARGILAVGRQHLCQPRICSARWNWASTW